MTIPSSKILKASKSLVAAASLQHHSPTFENGQSQNVNVIVHNSTPDSLKSTQNTNLKLKPAEGQKTEVPNEEDTEGIYVVYGEDNPYRCNTRDLKTAETNTEELAKLISEKDNLIKALSIIIEMFQNNPLMINKYIIATEETLKELIRLLTNADSVDIQLADLECSCSNPKTATIKRIFITVGDQIYSLDLCPTVLKLLETYKISLLLLALD